MNMNPWKRRQKLLEILCQRRHGTTDAFAREINVSRRTIHNDVLILSCSYPVESVQGKYGGVRVAEWFHLNRRFILSKNNRKRGQENDHEQEQDEHQPAA